MITEPTKKLARKLFAPDDAELVIAALDTAELPLASNNAERVHLAILHLSKGDLENFDRELRMATTDWRDTLVIAGLGHGNWEVVLKSWGVELSAR